MSGKEESRETRLGCRQDRCGAVTDPCTIQVKKDLVIAEGSRPMLATGKQMPNRSNVL